MKKLALLYAVMTLGMSSWAFAADNPPPPPEKGAQHQGKPPVKTANTKVSKRNTTANSHNETANSRSTTVNSRSTTASSRQRERAQRETAAAESVTLWPGFRVRPFHPSSAIVDKLLPFFEMPEKKPALRLT